MTIPSLFFYRHAHIVLCLLFFFLVALSDMRDTILCLVVALDPFEWGPIAIAIVDLYRNGTGVDFLFPFSFLFTFSVLQIVHHPLFFLLFSNPPADCLDFI